ncbi:uncharacterized protein LOC132950644 [Metopolophium dirhodum]|uniref:uncharacterized protein LOC132950644 n=1 Tax=Metopolophium dirhodum TaxID=44670 RepID=UPI00299044F6|nr:uncharacterized protein LOC132950644 [Metopolophium dirhodum]
MAMAELKHQMHMQEVEKKIKLLQMNWFIKNYEEANENPDKPKPTVSVQSTKLIDEIREMRTLIKDINGKLEEYQKEINAKEFEKPGETVPDISYMYPVPFDIEQQLYNGISRNEEGRYRYLKTRNRFSPDEKYRVCPTYNYKYGWNINKMGPSVVPKHGRKQVLKKAMYSIHGITLYDKHPTQRPLNSPGNLEIESL